jgi:pimeloyl-ACP methyl ester carboxylesterase
LTSAVNYYRANVGALIRRRFQRSEVPDAETRVRVPTLFIYGERDFAIVPETVRGVGDHVDAPYREVRLGRANHWVQQEHPAEVNAALLSFLDGGEL